MNSKLSLPENVTKFQDWMHTHAKGVRFRPPAKPTALTNYEEKSGLQIPGELRQILMVVDGEVNQSAGSIGNWRLMSITEIQAAWGLLTQLNTKGAFERFAPEPSPYLYTAWWSPAWVPFVTNDAGDYFCLDTNPPDPARKGQVLLFFQDRSTRPLVASNLTSWFDRILKDLLNGHYTYYEFEGFNGEAFLWSSLEGKHLLDHHAGKLIAQNDEDCEYK